MCCNNKGRWLKSPVYVHLAQDSSDLNNHTLCTKEREWELKAGIPMGCNLCQNCISI